MQLFYYCIFNILFYLRMEKITAVALEDELDCDFNMLELKRKK